MPYNPNTHLTEGVSRGSVKPLNYILNSSGEVLQGIAEKTGLSDTALFIIFGLLFLLFIFLLVIKFKPSKPDL